MQWFRLIVAYCWFHAGNLGDLRYGETARRRDYAVVDVHAELSDLTDFEEVFTHVDMAESVVTKENTEQFFDRDEYLSLRIEDLILT